MYNFDKLPNRYDTNSIKWNFDKDVLPMWVADMDFEAPDFIIDAINKARDRHVFGYSVVPDSFYFSAIDFFKRRHNIEFKKEEMIFTTGVVPALSSMVRKLTTPAENVVVLSPVYNCFYSSIINAGRKVLASELKYENHKYEIDFSDLEEKLSNPESTLMIFCNPHNPIGKVWKKEELKKVSELCHKYDVILISDEIHCDIVSPNVNYVPFASVDDNVITCISASKCFNLAGFPGSLNITKNKFLYNKIKRGFNSDEIAEGSAFVFDVFETAFNKGDKWLDELNEYIYKNRLYAKEFINNNIKDLVYIDSDSTYLIWVDISAVSDDSSSFTRFLHEKSRLYLSSGDIYGKNGKTFVRINLATSYSNVVEGLNRLKNGVELYKKLK